MNDLLVARLSAQGGFVTAFEAHSCGYTNLSLHRLVATGDLFRARAGCFVDGRLLNGASPERRHALTARAVSRGYRQPHAISHLSALVILGLPLLNITADVVHLTLTGPGLPRTVPGLRVHPELPHSVSRTVDGDRVVHPAMAIVQSAALAGITAGVAAADAGLYSGQGHQERSRDSSAHRPAGARKSRCTSCGRPGRWADRVPWRVMDAGAPNVVGAAEGRAAGGDP
jgi:hypothetical protein